MTTPNPSPDVAGIAARITKAQRDALTGAWECDRIWYHDGMDRTGLALWRRKLVANGGEVTPLGMLVRAHLLASETTNAD